MTWIVWNPHGVTPPKKEYKSEIAARWVARKMAAYHSGHIFYVMEAKSIHQVQGHQHITWWPDGGVTSWVKGKSKCRMFTHSD